MKKILIVVAVFGIFTLSACHTNKCDCYHFEKAKNQKAAIQ